MTSADLPHGYSAPVVSVYKISADVKKHGAIGGAQIFADGGNEAVIYIVFKTPALASRRLEACELPRGADLRSPELDPEAERARSTRAPERR